MKMAIASPQAGLVSGSGGLAGWLLEAARMLFRGRATLRPAEREMQLVETLSLGGRRQVLLVACGGERFLVGTGAETVHTIVQIAKDGRSNGANANREPADLFSGACR